MERKRKRDAKPQAATTAKKPRKARAAHATRQPVVKGTAAGADAPGAPGGPAIAGGGAAGQPNIAVSDKPSSCTAER